MRHGEAAPAHPSQGDAERRLTESGRRECGAIARALRGRDLIPTHVYASPFARALETAEVVRAALGLDGPLAPLAPLVPGGPSGPALAVLDEHADEHHVLFVSHEPTVRTLGRALGVELPPFPTAGLAVFDGARAFLGRLDPRLGWREPTDLGY